MRTWARSRMRWNLTRPRSAWKVRTCDIIRWLLRGDSRSDGNEQNESRISGTLSQAAWREEGVLSVQPSQVFRLLSFFFHSSATYSLLVTLYEGWLPRIVLFLLLRYSSLLLYHRTRMWMKINYSYYPLSSLLFSFCLFRIARGTGGQSCCRKELGKWYLFSIFVFSILVQPYVSIWYGSSKYKTPTVLLLISELFRSRLG